MALMHGAPYTPIMPTGPDDTERPDVAALYAAAAREKAEYRRIKAEADEQQDRLYAAVQALDRAGEQWGTIAEKLDIKRTTVQYMVNIDLESRRARRAARREESL